MSLLSRIKVWIPNEILTASDLNAEFNNVIDNGLVANVITGSSATVTAMQTLEDPGEVGTESLASSVEGEIRRLRNIISEITNKTRWYETPNRSMSTGGILRTTTTTSSNPSVTDINFLIADTTAGSVTLQGTTGAVLNQLMFIFKTSTSNVLTIAHNGTGTQKIFTSSGSSVNVNAGERGGALFFFDGVQWQPLNKEIDSGEVTLARLATNSVNSSKIVDLSVATADIADANVTKAKLAADAIFVTFADVTASPTTVGVKTLLYTVPAGKKALVQTRITNLPNAAGSLSVELFISMGGLETSFVTADITSSVHLWRNNGVAVTATGSPIFEANYMAGLCLNAGDTISITRSDRGAAGLKIAELQA